MSAIAAHELTAELRLQAPNRLGQRRLRDITLLGRPREIESIRERQEVAYLIEVHVRLSSCSQRLEPAVRTTGGDGVVRQHAAAPQPILRYTLDGTRDRRMNDNQRKYLSETLRLVAVAQLGGVGLYALRPPEQKWWLFALSIVVAGVMIEAGFTILGSLKKPDEAD